MRRISSRVLLFTVGLIVFVLGAVGFWTFDLLKSETKAYTFQSELLQTQLVGKPLVDQVNRIQSGIESGNLSADEQRSMALEHVYRLTRQDNQWKPEGDAPPNVQALISKLGMQGTALKVLSASDHLLALSRLGSGIGFLAIFNVNTVFKDCQGFPVFVVSSAGELLFSCDESLGQRFSKLDPSLLNKIKTSKFSAGSFETDPPVQDLWSYYQPNDLFSVVGLTPAMRAFRPAYFMGIRLALLVLSALGISIIISVAVARKVTGPIEVLTIATKRIAEGEFDVPIEVKSRDETRVLADSVRLMAQKIKSLILSEVQKTKLESQLEVAGTVQRTLIPDSSLQLPGLKVESFYKPADQCGGDWWGYVQAGKQVAVIIGDVTGHGYPSALLVATTRGFLSMLQANAEADGGIRSNASDILNHLNRVVFDATKSELNMTALCVVLDLETGAYHMASAAHNSAYVIHKMGDLKSVKAKGPRLGEAPSIEGGFEMKSGELDYGEKFVLYTDGIQDLGGASEVLGRKGFQEFLEKRTQSSAEGLVQAVAMELLPMNAGRSLQDDVTFVVLERVPGFGLRGMSG